MSWLTTFSKAASADQFVWLTGTDAMDTIRDFSPGDGDTLNFREIVRGFAPGISETEDSLSFATDKKRTTVSLDVDGSDAAAKTQAFAVLAGFDPAGTTVESLLADGNILLA
jgi:hypothetical protein